MYKYIKGTTVISDKKMLDAKEIAEKYGLWDIQNDELVPHNVLVENIILTYIEMHNLNVSEYYYIDPYKTSFRVYPIEMFSTILDTFIKDLKSNGLTSNPDAIYGWKDIEFIYCTEHKIQSGKIINIADHLKRKENQDDNKMP